MLSKTEQLGQTQLFSKLVLGSTYRLEVGAWIARVGGEPINPTQFRKSLERVCSAPPSHSSVVQELQNFVRAGLLDWSTSSGGRIEIRPTSQTYFRSCLQLLSEIDANSPIVKAEVTSAAHETT